MIVLENKVFETALQKFGLEKQIIKCVEELSELQKEFCKFLLGQGNRDNITEEIADVEIMLEQMKIGLSIGLYELNAARNKKVIRLGERLDQSIAKEKLTESEYVAKCNQCLYDVMTKEDLERLGKDPCETCNDLSNWKAKEAQR